MKFPINALPFNRVKGTNTNITNVAYIILVGMLFTNLAVAQSKPVEKSTDSILTIYLEEVILVNAKNALEYHKQPKPLASLDDYLDKGQKVDMVKRGAYAWEPMVNSMTSERLSVTIDGMRIFSACTDKMDPVTSYVDVSNLGAANISSGQQGAEHGVTIGGAIDLELDKSGFSEQGLRISLENGFETNNEQKIIGAEANFGNSKWYGDGDIIYRKAENYVAGGGQEVAFSQFEKYNLSLNGGHKLNEDQEIAATLIYDEARNVGYPALPMDVSLAQGLISSLEFKSQNLGMLTNFRTKIYFNTITHIMDDSQRPDVPVRMDMPGWSDTFGFLNEGTIENKDNSIFLKWDGFYNQSLAEMTMFPNNPNEPSMFMLTWPDVRTLNSGLYGEYTTKSLGGDVKLSSRVSVQENKVASEFGLNSLRIFYPEISDSRTRLLKSFALQWQTQVDKLEFVSGLSFGDRAPSVSEGYGFYLFNSFDNHDYIGNPNLENEQSFEINAQANWKHKDWKVSLSGNYFHLPNYIIGEIDSELSTMTIGAAGVKRYTNLDYATQYNLALFSSYEFDKNLKGSGSLSYHRGFDASQRNLPFISPLAYGANLEYSNKGLSASIQMRGAGDQTNFNPEFGEDRTEAYTVFSMNFGKTFYFNNTNILYAKVGAENIFDTLYSTYTDWANIPRMGRNFFVTVSYKIN